MQSKYLHEFKYKTHVTGPEKTGVVYIHLNFESLKFNNSIQIKLFNKLTDFVYIAHTEKEIDTII